MPSPNVIITVARKPLMGGTLAKNALKHGTGGLNIDGTRIGMGGEYDPTKVHRQQNSCGAVVGAFGASSLIGKEIPTYNPGGRWPANMILVHLEGCHQSGYKVVEANGIHGEGVAVRRSGVHADAGGHQTIGRVQPVRGYADENGNETVPAWDCQPGCPVAALDDQSGDLSIRGGPKNTTHTAGMFGIGTPGTVYTDKGGASRFFKQVAGPEDA